ncbi:UBX domain-containing protein 2A isoform X2 [Embiotoca jacksoni]
MLTVWIACFDSFLELIIKLHQSPQEKINSKDVPPTGNNPGDLRELPAEWESRAEEEELEISVEDLTEENYVRKKKAFHPFSGRGYRLGSVAPRVVARSPSVHEDGESPPIPMVTLDHALPVTSLQIWLADGTRLVQRFNLSHRIADVQDFVARCQRSSPPFVLTTSLPFRELTDKELSLEEADLANAVIVQRPLNTQAPFGHS